MSLCFTFLFRSEELSRNVNIIRYGKSILQFMPSEIKKKKKKTANKQTKPKRKKKKKNSTVFLNGLLWYLPKKANCSCIICVTTIVFCLSKSGLTFSTQVVLISYCPQCCLSEFYMTKVTSIFYAVLFATIGRRCSWYVSFIMAKRIRTSIRKVWRYQRG